MLDRGVHPNGANVPVGDLADPHVEAEIAFLLGQDLKGPGITPVHVISATQAVLAAIELVDLKVQGEGLQATDVIAHNALHGGVVVGSRLMPLGELDLQFEGVTVEFNGVLEGTGTGSEVMGNPINSIVWLANKLAEFDDFLRAGEIIISGSIVTPIRVRSGDHIKVTYTRIGAVGAKFI
jgi:2-keto-4-pentenoate hydratase